MLLVTTRQILVEDIIKMKLAKYDGCDNSSNFVWGHY